MADRVSVDGFALDHVLYGGRDLARLERAFERYGMTAAYGGAHENGATHNAVVGFDDGTYVELLALRGEGPAPRRDALLRGDVGPCGWALETDDAARAADRFRARGVAVDGPVTLGRERPDGTTTRWDLAFLGPGDPGSYLPFLIEDVTPRETRVEPTAGVADSELAGVARVVVGVPDLDASVETFRRAFDLPEPKRGRDAVLDAAVAVFPGGVALASADAGWLADRVDRYGPLVCGFLVGTTDPAETAARRGSVAPVDWCPGGWFPSSDAFGGRVGIEDVS